MTDELRQFLREQCLDNFYVFLKLACGYNDIDPNVHGHVTNYMQRQRQHKLVVLPRGFLKTTCCTIGYAAWRAVKDPEIRILIANATATNASHFIRAIEGLFEKSEMLRWLFPEVIPKSFGDVKWTDTEMCLVRRSSWPESTIECIGVGGTVVSRHYNLIIEDDLIAPEDGYVTTDMVMKVIEWHKYATSLLINPTVDEQVVVGTRWLYDDFIAYLFLNEKWFLPCVYKGPYAKDGSALWPQRFGMETLDRILEQQGPRIFSTQYLNDPVHEDARSFDTAWFRYFTTFPPRNDRDEVQPVKCVTAIDPAISQKKHGDYSAIVTVATDLERNRYVVDARRGRWGVDELIDHVFDVFRTWKPVKVGLETTMFQKALLYPFREAMRRESVNLPLVELRPSSKVTKEGRIQALHEFFANGSVWLSKLHTDLLAELRGWPAVSHDDMLDALAYAMQMLVYPSQEMARGYMNTMSFEFIMKNLKGKGQGTGQAPFLWPLNGKLAPVYANGGGLPQTMEEIAELIQEVKLAR